MTGHGLIARDRGPELECVACMEKSRLLQRAPVECAHVWCRDCLQKLFRASFTDESLFPPKCCGNILEPNAVRINLTGDIIKQYDIRKKEMEDPNRTYCSRENCSAYIDQENVYNDCARCPDCTAKTCVTCKGAYHDGDCPNDTGLQLVLANANREGWQRCSACRTMVDLTVGCNHIT